MSKQTVEERYNKQQMMKGELKPKELAHKQIQSEQQQNIQKIFNKTKQALQDAHQAVRQAQAANPAQAQLRMADERLTNATQLMHKLQTTIPGTALGFTKGEQQQLKQLDYQIQTAKWTFCY